MAVKLARFILVAALLLSVGFHWALVQSAAWVGMVYSFASKGVPVGQALVQTFDGEHPCALCRALDEAAKKEAQPKDESVKVKKLELFSEPRRVVEIYGVVPSCASDERMPVWVSVAEDVECPPPRAVA